MSSSAGGQRREEPVLVQVEIDTAAIQFHPCQVVQLFRAAGGDTLALYTINQTTLKWYEDRAKREEILSRMQELELPAPLLLAKTDLPPAHDQPLSPPTPPGPIHQFPELEDTTRQARRRAAAGLGHHEVHAEADLNQQQQLSPVIACTLNATLRFETHFLEFQPPALVGDKFGQAVVISER